MRLIFPRTIYIQCKGGGTRRYTFRYSNTEYEKKNYTLLDFCAVAECFEEKYDYSLPLNLPSDKKEPKLKTGEGQPGGGSPETPTPPPAGPQSRVIPVWEGTDTLVSREVIEVGQNGEKVDVMTFRGSFERDVKEFAQRDPEMKMAVADEDDDTVETIMNERFYYKPEMYYSPDKLIRSYGVPAPTPAFVYNAVGKKPLPTKNDIVPDTVASTAPLFNLLYPDHPRPPTTTHLLPADPQELPQLSPRHT